jgi:hypothetical protein
MDALVPTITAISESTPTVLNQAFAVNVQQKNTFSLLRDLGDRRSQLSPEQINTIYEELIARVMKDKWRMSSKDMALFAKLKTVPLCEVEEIQLWTALPLDT